jgi:hypothetical protein
MGGKKRPARRADKKLYVGIREKMVNTTTLDRRSDGSHCRSGHCGEEDDLLPMPEMEIRFVGHSFMFTRLTTTRRHGENKKTCVMSHTVILTN